MIRFTIKGVLYLTMIVASYLAIAKLGPTPAGLVMFLVYYGLIFYAVLRPDANRPSAQ